MLSSRRVLLAGAFLVAGSASSVLAQERGGFFFGIGLGYGSNWVSCSGCESTRSDGFAGFFKIGAHLSDQLGLGFESNGWFGSVESSDVWSSNFSGVVYFYPGGGNVMLRGGLGLATVEASFQGPLGGRFISNEWGFGATAGVGIDIPVGFVAVINPVVNLNYGNYGTVQTPVENLTGTNSLVLQLAVGVTFQ